MKLTDLISEKAKRDYKAEYKKYGSSTKSKKYRAELNANKNNKLVDSYQVEVDEVYK